MVHVPVFDSAEGIPPADSEEMRFAILEALVEKEDIATGQDIREIIRKTLDLTVRYYQSYHTTVSNALIQMSYEGLVDKPFGDMRNGNAYERRNWLRRYRLGQNDQQVWRITNQGKSELAQFKASGQDIHKSRRSWLPYQTNPDSSESRNEIEDARMSLGSFTEEALNLSNMPDLTGDMRDIDLGAGSAVHLEEDQHIDRFEETSASEPNTDYLDASISEIIRSREQQFTSSGVFTPNDLKDARERISGSIVRRRGQPEFRNRLLQIYNNTCIVSGTNFPQALEAAHIVSYKGEHTNHVSNGLLLRADIHTLFDLRLITIDIESNSLLLAPILHSSSYSDLHGKLIVIPCEEEGGPSREALKQHKQESGL